MAFCGKCGNMVPKGSKFCMNCGASVALSNTGSVVPTPSPAPVAAPEPVPEPIAAPAPAPVPATVVAPNPAPVPPNTPYGQPGAPMPPQKGKSKLPLILGIAAAVIVAGLTGFGAYKFIGGMNTGSPATGTALTQMLDQAGFNSQFGDGGTIGE